jgi:pantoate--beta-alanine ligase
MKVFETITALRQYLNENRTLGHTIGFVPTMGCLHQGHCALISQSAHENDITVLSIFLNPTQFSCREDFDRYPRCQADDMNLAKKAGATVIFAPTEKEVYPHGFQTVVDVPELAKPMCGEKRPGHFTGMATIVLKLLNIVSPNRAYFGQKDYQQVCIVKQMVRDLNLETEIIACPTVREESGLACSSRNTRLTPEEKERASWIYRLLQETVEAAECNSISTEAATALHDQLKGELADHGMQVEYVEIVDGVTLQPRNQIEGGTLVAVAVFIGEVRLIDNVLISGKA